MRLWTRVVATWGLLLVVMFGNGTVRALVLQPRMGEHLARQLSSLSGICLVFAVATLLARGGRGATSGQLLGAGCVWLALTMTFELGFGRFVSGSSWSELLADYNLARGRLWPLVLLATLLAPWVCGRVSGALDGGRG
jgi:hypothetical protein